MKGNADMRMEPKPFASLSSGLLARKGQARPAMRPQAIRHDAPRLDDLGWDDMGMDIAPPVPEPVAADAPAPFVADHADVAPDVPMPVAEVIQQIETAFSEAAVLATTPRRRAEPGSKGKSAFTLRLDPERHLKLRLACALKYRSAQRVVIDALDIYLASVPGLDDAVRLNQTARAK
mgnify:CR=1 FL=1